MLCFVGVMQSFIMNSHEVFIHIHQGCFAGTGAIVTLPQCQWSKPDGHGKISQCITTTKPSKAKTVCIFLGIYCNMHCYDIFEWVISWWQVSGNGLVPSGYLQLPESVMTKCRHLTSLGAYELNSIPSLYTSFPDSQYRVCLIWFYCHC